MQLQRRAGLSGLQVNLTIFNNASWCPCSQASLSLGDAGDEAEGPEPEDAELEGFLKDRDDLRVTVVRGQLGNDV